MSHENYIYDISIENGVFIATDQEGVKRAQFHSVINCYTYDANPNVNAPAKLKIVEKYGDDLELNVDNVANISGSPFFGDFDALKTQITALLDTLNNPVITTTPGTNNEPFHETTTNPSSKSYSGFKKLSFVADGAITVRVNGNAVVYPQSFADGTIAGTTFEADDASIYPVVFDGTGTIIVTIQK